mgnify:CR=1 FL=1
MTSQSNPKHLRFTAALTPKSLSRICATLVVCLVATGFGTANADIIADRKAGFKRNADSMKAIAAAIGSGDYQTVISRAEGITSWASKIPSYFPEGSDSGDTKARAEIWFEFDAFKVKAKANETAARSECHDGRAEKSRGKLQILPFQFQRLDRQNWALRG